MKYISITGNYVSYQSLEEQVLGRRATGNIHIYANGICKEAAQVQSFTFIPVKEFTLMKFTCPRWGRAQGKASGASPTKATAVIRSLGLAGEPPPSRNTQHGKDGWKVGKIPNTFLLNKGVKTPMRLLPPPCRSHPTHVASKSYPTGRVVVSNPISVGL